MHDPTWSEYGSPSASVAVQRGPFEMVPHWLLDDPDLTSHAIRTYLVLRSFGDENRPSWPGRSLLAKRLGVSPSTVSRAISELEAVGALCYRNRPGDGNQMQTNLYHIHWERDDNCGWFADESPSPYMNHPLPPVNRPLPPVADPLPPVDRELIPKEPIPSEQQDLVQRVQKPAGEDEAFTAFWSIYPRRQAKGHALRAWRKATRATDPRLILAGAVRYRDDPNRSPEYTALPATWLNGERWTDDPLPGRQSRSDRKLSEAEAMIRRAAQRDYGIEEIES